VWAQDHAVTVLVPDSLDVACEALAEWPGSTLIAGGTDLMVDLNAGRSRPDTVVAIGRLAELRAWSVSGDQVTIGAGVSYRTMLQEPIASVAPVLAHAARSVGSPQIRNAGTLGGNLATASPAGDGIVASVALGGTVTLQSAAGSRQVDLSDFVTGPRRTARRADEVIVAIRLPVCRGPQEFLKVGSRNAMVIAVASAALVVDPARRVVRLVLGSVGPGPVRCTDAAAFAAEAVDWDTLTATPESAREFASLAVRAATPIDDHRASAAYRRRAVEVIARRAFERSFVR
jgi:CO/xanthine dehydrogenase FAD-binding subunit